MDKIVNDKSKFKVVKETESDQHPVIKNEQSVQNAIRNHIKKHVEPNEYLKMYPNGSQPGKLYGQCKVHKDGNPLRPVVSMVGTAPYHLAKYLDQWIKPCIPDKYMLNSTVTFLSKLKSFFWLK